jgi:predicted AlkP superfamily phosphohydrolase/phosphomutase
MEKKLIVLGFDGATFDLIEPFEKEGILPNFSHVLNKGVSASLQSVIPPVSAPAWTSIVTGTNPGKHNIYGFTDGKGRVVNSTFRKSEAIWNILDKHKKRSIVINLPVTYPPEKIHGKIYSGVLDPEEKGYRGRFQIDKEAFIEKKKALKKMFHWEKAKTEKALEILQKEEWNLFFILYFLSDFVPTIYWKYMDKTHPQHSYDEVLSNAVKDAYILLDTFLGKFLSAIDENTNVVVVSDHGIGPSKMVLNINEWMRRAKFLSVKMGTYEKAVSPDKVAQVVDSLSFLKKIVALLPDSLLKRAYKLVFSRSRNMLSRMDKHTSQAYAYSHAHFASVWLLDHDEKILSAIEEKIKELKDPKTGEKIITRTYRQDSLFHGDWVDNAPDLIVEAVPYCSIRSQRMGTLFSEPLQSGDHRMNGIFIAYGPDVINKERTNISIFDVCPSLLALLDVPVPAHMDGTAVDMFPEGYKVKLESAESTREAPEQFYTEEEEEKIKKRLSALGYFD